MGDWIEKVRAGDFKAIPWHVTFDEACQLALLIEGYETAGGHAECFQISRCVVDRIARKVGDRVLALDLWITLFAQQRAYRFGGYPPTDSEIDLFLDLVRYLRGALRNLNSAQRAGIMAIMIPEEVPQDDSRGGRQQQLLF
jgi:hypothetical protein